MGPGVNTEKPSRFEKDLQARFARFARGAPRESCFRYKNSNGMSVARTSASPQVATRARMNWDRVQGNWKQVAGRIQQRWGRLTEDTLREIAGQREELVGKIQEAYGISRDDAGRRARERSRGQRLVRH